MSDVLGWAGPWPSVIELMLAGLAGAALGAFFFGGLWWTARRGAVSPRPAAWFFGSLLLRMGLVLPAFLVVGGGHWVRLLSCLLGFVVARTVVTRLARPPSPIHAGTPRGIKHAP